MLMEFADLINDGPTRTYTPNRRTFNFTSTMGLLFSIIDQISSPPKATWTTTDVPDLSGRVMLVTGN